MDRPKTGTPGRRRLRTGSVRVTELMGGRRIRIPEPAAPPAGENARPRPSVIDGPDALRGPAGGLADEQATVRFDRVRTGDTDTLEIAPEASAPPVRSSRAVRVAQAAVLGLAVAALCGAVAVAAVVTRQRAADSADNRPSLQITGERALLPDRFVAAYTDTGRRARIAPPTTAAAPDRRVVARTTEAEGSTSPANSLPAARPVVSPRDVVLEFYRLVPEDPSAAFDLVAGAALGTSRAEFTAAYRAVREVSVVSVEAGAAGRGEVLAVVVLTLDDGSTLRVRQLLTVSGTAPQRISDAELLAVQPQ